jgi:uncharacterized protein (DUF2267 family)
MDYDRMIERFADRTGIGERSDAERAFRGSLSALGRGIEESDRDLLFGSLPDEVRRAIRGSRFEHAEHVEDLGRAVASSAGIELGLGVEQVEVACQVLADAMTADAMKLVRLHLPEEISALFDAPRERVESGQREALSPRIGMGSTLADGRPTSRHPISASEPENTLATGRPGSAHPLSEAQGTGTAHEESVVKSPNPHGARKLSSGSR